MKELSIFIDESGDFGAYSKHSPYYIISMVFHNQSLNIDQAVLKLNQELKYAYYQKQLTIEKQMRSILHSIKTKTKSFLNLNSNNSSSHGNIIYNIINKKSHQSNNITNYNIEKNPIQKK